MASLWENTNKVVTSFDEIRQAIIGKGVDVPDGTSVEEYASLIASIVVGFDASSVTAEAGDVLEGKIIIGSDGTEVEGTMTNNGSVSAILSADESYTIPEGFHDGNGKVTAQSLVSQTDGTAIASQILSGETAYVDGEKVTGTMANFGDYECEVEAASIVVDGMTGLAGNTELPGGYYSGITITPPTVDIADYTKGTAIASDLAVGKTAWVNGTMITGTKEESGKNMSYVVGEFDTPSSIASDAYADVTVTFDNELGFIPSMIVFTEDMIEQPRIALFNYAILALSETEFSVRVYNPFKNGAATRKVRYIVFE